VKQEAADWIIPDSIPDSMVKTEEPLPGTSADGAAEAAAGEGDTDYEDADSAAAVAGGTSTDGGSGWNTGN
jgi:hypothetical protein